jgi:peptide chain release factor 1
MKELGELEPIALKYKEYKKAKEEMEAAREMLDSDDEEMKELAKMEIADLEDKIPEIENDLKILMLPKDPNDDKNVILEVRAGTGGDEAALFGMDLLRMYLRYAERRGWKAEVIDANETDIGGVKEAEVMIKGKGAYSRLKYESGTHRVQRVPQTESSGRIHTSAATVAVLPEADATEVRIDPKDLRIDIFRSSGAGGQHINKTSSAIRITHIPSGLVVTCQDERSQHQNKEKAMAVLQSRLWAIANQGDLDAENSERRSQVGTGDRSERIRTYNYHQGRVTDHRIGLTLYRLEEILAGDLDEIVDALTLAKAAEEEKNGTD